MTGEVQLPQPCNEPATARDVQTTGSAAYFLNINPDTALEDET